MTRDEFPAVIAMQASIPDSKAAVFSREFYPVLAQAHSVEEALGEARMGLFEEQDLSWAMPVLFLHGSGRIFPVPDPVSGPKASDGSLEFESVDTPAKPLASVPQSRAAWPAIEPGTSSATEQAGPSDPAIENPGPGAPSATAQLDRDVARSVERSARNVGAALTTLESAAAADGPGLDRKAQAPA